MSNRLALGIGLVATLVASGASAQEVTVGYQGLPYKAGGESNTGIQVSDGVLLHVGVGAEAGYDSNVFYQDSANALGSGLIRVLPWAELANATRTGPVSKEIVFDLRAGAQYRHYLSNDVSVKPYSDTIMPTAGASLSLGGGQVGFGLADTFVRIEDPPYGPSNPNGGLGGAPANAAILRDNNQFSAEGRWAPGGGRLTSLLRYTNMVDIFEGLYDYASTDSNFLMLDIAWKWLPKTAVFVNAQQGYVFYLNQTAADANAKASSYPLRVTAGLRGLLTEKTSAVLSAGYVNGFYQAPTNPAAVHATTGGVWGSLFIDASLTVRPTMMSRVVLGYRHDFANAVVATYANTDTGYASYVQQVAGRLALDLSGRYAHASYQGNFVDPNQVGRKDNIIQVGATLDYFLRNWTYAGVAYSLVSDSVSPSALNLDYVKQQMFVRLGITY
jgi:hypothetical protein